MKLRRSGGARAQEAWNGLVGLLLGGEWFDQDQGIRVVGATVGAAGDCTEKEVSKSCPLPVQRRMASFPGQCPEVVDTLGLFFSGFHISRPL